MPTSPAAPAATAPVGLAAAPVDLLDAAVPAAVADPDPVPVAADPVADAPVAVAPPFVLAVVAATPPPEPPVHTGAVMLAVKLPSWAECSEYQLWISFS